MEFSVWYALQYMLSNWMFLHYSIVPACNGDLHDIDIEKWNLGEDYESNDMKDFLSDTYDYSYEYPQETLQTPSSPESVYRTVTNASQETETTGEQNALKFLKSLQNITKEIGDTMRFKCEVEGYPQVTRFKWLKNDAPLIEEKGRIIMRRYRTQNSYGTRLKISDLDIHDMGFYTCEASNGRTNIESTGVLTVRISNWKKTDPLVPHLDFPEVISEFSGFEKSLQDFKTSVEFDTVFPYFSENDSVKPNILNNGGHCETYRGTVCKNYIGNKTIFIKWSMSQKVFEKKLIEAFTSIMQSSYMSPLCSKYALPALCFSSFPPCDESEYEPKPMHICRDECQQLTKDICRHEYDLAKKHDLFSGLQILPDCDLLPSISPINRNRCAELGLQRARIIENGRLYRGIKNFTASGYDCLIWSQKIFLKITDFPELLGGHNYCRNPGGTELKPWCFVGSRLIKEVCDIPKCDDKLWLYVSFVGLGSFLIVSLFLGLCLYKNAYKCKNSGNNIVVKHQVEMHSLLQKSQFSALELPLKNLCFLQQIGEGSFGQMNGDDAERIQNPVVIKTLREKSSSKVQKNFQCVAYIMSQLCHPNIIKLFGTNFKEKPQCLIFEYMAFGDLHQFLLCHAPHIDTSVYNSNSLSTEDMIYIATQIASAMDYISQHHYIYVLLAKKCLVAEKMIVKLADSFICLNNQANKHHKSQMLQSLHWMAPEALLQGTFTTYSNIWSFGILLWEIFSYGLQPYQNYSNSEVVKMIKNRQLLSCPSGCPNKVYMMMTECWHETPCQRPLFAELYNRLLGWQKILSPPSQSSCTHCSGSSNGPSNTTTSTSLTHLRNPVNAPSPHSVHITCINDSQEFPESRISNI